ncbi:MAG: hypothetical protein M1480_08005 [Bacteroidetes bacterium]|nr:hypothetical protein [Bacteroidota bacterium]
MTRIILESKNKNDVMLIKELAERLNISYKIQTIPAPGNSEKNLEHYYKIINKIVDVSNYGDPSQWQKKVREDRSINIS